MNAPASIPNMTSNSGGIPALATQTRSTRSTISRGEYASRALFSSTP
jgi:hypothetical protein